MNYLLKRLYPSVARRTLALALAISASLAVGAAENRKGFATPEEAVAALAAAAAARDTNAFRVLFGPAAADLENPDRVQAAHDLGEFVSAFHQTNRIAHESDSKCVLEVGREFWPFPVPLVKQDGRWLFDTAAGQEELINRRIGRNERLTLRSVRAYVQAQSEYASKDRDGDRVLEYAQKFRSTPGTKDGLFWPSDLEGDDSPFGPLFAHAQAQGYSRQPGAAGAKPEPFQGYFFKILNRQGKAAPGGKYHYLINGNMIGGFALVAWPAAYDETGIMTFIVNQEGRVYQKDLGLNSARIAAAMKEYDPDKTWAISRE